MSSVHRNDGVPFRVGPIPGKAPDEERWAGANEAKTVTLQLRSLRRLAGAGGLEVRHSDYGYALIGADRKSVNGRNDMTLKEVESWLKTAGQS